jgi:hypothetical protein
MLILSEIQNIDLVKHCHSTYLKVLKIILSKVTNFTLLRHLRVHFCNSGKRFKIDISDLTEN